LATCDKAICTAVLGKFLLVVRPSAVMIVGYRRRTGGNRYTLVVLPLVACLAVSACRAGAVGVAVVLAGVADLIVCTSAAQGSVVRFVRAGTAGGVAAGGGTEAPAIGGVAGSLDLSRTC
jgi:hypothetical protein